MKLPVPKKAAKTEDVKWPTITFAQEMAASIAKKRKRQLKKADPDATE